MNIVIMVGNVGKEPTIQQAGNSKVCRFSLAVTARANEPVLWVNCEAWDGGSYQLATLMHQHVRKGQKITILGELREQSWTDRGGQARKSTYVRLANAQWDASANRQQQQQEPQGNGDASQGSDGPPGW